MHRKVVFFDISIYTRAIVEVYGVMKLYTDLPIILLTTEDDGVQERNDDCCASWFSSIECASQTKS